ncbi:unnamed protein product, partial [Acanthoscelides obtectus]
VTKTELNREHFRAIIYYHFQRQFSQQECLAELLSVFGNEAPHHLSDDPRENVDAIEASSKISKTSIQKILHEELGVRKLVSRWIPHLLTDEQKTARVNWCQKTLDPLLVVINRGFISAVWVFQGEEKPTKMVATFVSKADNASSHTAQKTKQYLTEENVELLDHPLYSPDPSRNDFFTFPKIENRLRSQRFQSPEEAWNKCFENWFERMQMCINLRDFC